MSRKILRQFAPVFLAVLLIASPAHANTILPLFFMSWMAMVLALLPIIVIETIVLSVRAGTSLWESILVASVGNLASTFIGIPVALILHAIFRASLDDTPKRLRTAWEKFRMVVWHVQYVYDEEGRLPDWMWLGGCLVLVVPFFLASWLSESWVARILLDGYSARGLDQAVFGANLVTYGLLVALLSALLVWAIRNPSAEVAWDGELEPVFELDDPWRIANRRARRGIARLKAKEVKIARRYQARPMHSADLHKSWRLANARARRGITWLKVAETSVDRQRLIRAAADIRRFEEASDAKAA